MLIKGEAKRKLERKVHHSKKIKDISSYYSFQKKKPGYKSDRNYVKGSDVGWKLDFEKYPCCGGKGFIMEPRKATRVKERYVMVKCKCQGEKSA